MDIMTANLTREQLTFQALQQVAGLILIEVALIFLLPANHAVMRAHHFSAFEYRTILFALAIPTLATWGAAFYGSAKLRQYAQTIQATPEGPYFRKLAVGCIVLAWSLPVSSILLLILSAAVQQWSGFYATAVIFRNYTNLVLAIVAFSVIGNATRALINQARLKFSLASIRSIILVFLVAGVLYCYLTFRYFNLTSLGSTHNSYYLPIWLMVISIMIPYLYAWFSGLLAAYEISLLSQHTNGLLYRQALHLLSLGLLTIIVSSVAIQYLNSLHPEIGLLSLDYRMVLSTLFRVVSGAGFLLLALGAMRLKKIEEV
jgi:hypothetical protein